MSSAGAYRKGHLGHPGMSLSSDCKWRPTVNFKKRGKKEEEEKEKKEGEEEGEEEGKEEGEEELI